MRSSFRRALTGAARGWLCPFVLITLAVFASTPELELASGAAGVPSGITAGPWTLRSSQTMDNDNADQGVATVSEPNGTSKIVTRGGASVSPRLRRQGWVHIGDPDSYRGYLLDAYQGRAGANAKLFVLTAPDGRQRYYVHPLARGESYNNSFAAIAPGGRWFVSGEWGTVRRLLLFRLPGFDAPAALSRDLQLSGAITLTRPMRDVQGCAFNAPTAMVCATDDPGTDLYGVPRQLLAVRLARPPRAGTVDASVSLLGAVPQLSSCLGPSETEGLDIHGSRLLVAAVSSCRNSTTLYSYYRGDRSSAGGS
ncbi:MAG: hypothetical protein ACRDWT_12280 [Jatrophihabitantaceae bacterium]